MSIAEHLSSTSANRASTNGHGANIDPIYRNYRQYIDGITEGEIFHDSLQDTLEPLALDNERAVTAGPLGAMATTPVHTQGDGEIESYDVGTNKGTLLFVGEPALGKTTLMDGLFRAFGYAAEDIVKIPRTLPPQRLTGFWLPDGWVTGILQPHHKAVRLDEANRMSLDLANEMLDIADGGFIVSDERVVLLQALRLVVSTINPTETRQATMPYLAAMASRNDVGVALNPLSESSAQKLVRTRTRPSDVPQIIDDDQMDRLSLAADTRLIPEDFSGIITRYAYRARDLLRQRFNLGENSARMVEQISKLVVSLYVLDGRLPDASSYAKRVLGYMAQGALPEGRHYRKKLTDMVVPGRPMAEQRQREVKIFDAYTKVALGYVIPQRLVAVGKKITKDGQLIGEAIQDFTDEVIG